MKKILTLFAFVLCAYLATAQTAEPATQVDGPVFTFEEMVIDYGEIDQGSDPFRTFHFTNTGNEPAIIKTAKGSCGCTTPSWPKEPIMPGEASEIQVRYDTNRVGPFTKTVKLSTNMGDENIILTIKGKVLKGEEKMAAPKKDKTAF